MDEMKNPNLDGWGLNYKPNQNISNGLLYKGGSGMVAITLEEIEEIIEVLDQYTRKIRDSWDVNIKKAMDTLSSSWAGEACAQYINMIKDLDKNVQSALKALELLSNTYKTAREKTISTNSTVFTSVNSI